MSLNTPSGSPQAGPPPEALQDFPVWQGVTEAYRRTLANLPHFPAAAALPTVLTVILNIFWIRMAVETLAAPERGNPILLVALVLLGNCPYILFAVAWFRLVLLGEARAQPRLFSGWKLRHWRSLRYVFAMFGIAMVAGMVATTLLTLVVALFYGAEALAAEGGVGEGFFLLAMLASLIIMIAMLRFSFVFPAAAVDETYGLAMSWRHTKGQALRLFVASLLIAMPFVVVTSLVGGLFGSPFAVTGLGDGTGAAQPEVSFGLTYYILEGIMVVLGYLMTAALIQMLGLAFQLCTGWVADENAGPPTRHDGSAFS